MKEKDLKAIAEKIASFEQTIRTSKNRKVIDQAEIEIEKLLSDIYNFNDMEKIDEMVIEILEKNKKNS